MTLRGATFHTRVSPKVFIKLFCKSQFPHKFVWSRARTASRPCKPSIFQKNNPCMQPRHEEGRGAVAGRCRGAGRRVGVAPPRLQRQPLSRRDCRFARSVSQLGLGRGAAHSGTVSCPMAVLFLQYETANAMQVAPLLCFEEAKCST